MTRIRKSVPTEGVHNWWDAGWMYVMPDFDNKNHSIIEWISNRAPVEPSTAFAEASPKNTEHEAGNVVAGAE